MKLTILKNPFENKTKIAGDNGFSPWPQLINPRIKIL